MCCPVNKYFKEQFPAIFQSPLFTIGNGFHESKYFDITSETLTRDSQFKLHLGPEGPSQELLIGNISELPSPGQSFQVLRRVQSSSGTSIALLNQ